MNDELRHHGILGQKWGVRRYQNKDGSLTDAGRRRMNKLKEREQKLEYKKYVASNKKKLSRKDQEKIQKINNKLAKNDLEKYKLQPNKYKVRKLDRDSIEIDGVKRVQNALAKHNRKTDLKNLRSMSDRDLQGKIERLRLEQQYKSALIKDLSPVRSSVNKVLKDASMDLGKNAAKNTMRMAAAKVFGKDVADAVLGNSDKKNNSDKQNNPDKKKKNKNKNRDDDDD